MTAPNPPSRYAEHTAASDPGSHADQLAGVGTDPESLHQAAMRTILHYRDEAGAPTTEQVRDIDLRRLSAILATATERGPRELMAERPPAQRVGGCCRDHSLLSVAVLRHHDIPARTRVGFAAYLDGGEPGFHADHVIGERWDGQRWVRFDPELTAEDYSFDVHDIPAGPGAPFQTAAEAWNAWRATEVDAHNFGTPGAPALRGPWFIQGYVLVDLAHRMGVETLLWDGWGARAPIGAELASETIELTDRIAGLTVRADAGSEDAERELVELWDTDDRVRPGPVVRTLSPSGRVGSTDLATGVTTWE